MAGFYSADAFLWKRLDLGRVVFWNVRAVLFDGIYEGGQRSPGKGNGEWDADSNIFDAGLCLGLPSI